MVGSIRSARQRHVTGRDRVVISTTTPSFGAG
jgi:hypothetical protein